MNDDYESSCDVFDDLVGDDEGDQSPKEKVSSSSAAIASQSLLELVDVAQANLQDFL